MKLISVHIPKAGGTSLRQVLEAHYGSGFVPEYDHHPPVGLRHKLLRRFPKGSPFIPGVSCIHGHFKASLYRGGDLVTFIRHPLDIRISKWHFMQRNFEISSPLVQEKWKGGTSLSLEEYVSVKHGDLSEYIDVDLSKFTFIGKVESYLSDLNYFCKNILKSDYKMPHVNANPDGNNYDLDYFLEIFKEKNSSEVDFYKKAKDLSMEMMG